MLQGTEGAVQKRTFLAKGHRLKLFELNIGGDCVRAFVSIYNWCFTRRNGSYYNVNMKPNNAFPGSAVRQKMETKSISCYFLSARWLCRQWDIFFCLCLLIITLLTSVQFCQLVSAEMWPSACLQFIKTIHPSGSCRQCVLWGNLSFSAHTSTCPLSRHTLFKLLVVFSSRKCKILFLITVVLRVLMRK